MDLMTPIMVQFSISTFMLQNAPNIVYFHELSAIHAPLLCAIAQEGEENLENGVNVSIFFPNPLKNVQISIKNVSKKKILGRAWP